MTGALVTRKFEPDKKIRLCSYFTTGKESPQFSQKECHKKGRYQVIGDFLEINFSGCKENIQGEESPAQRTPNRYAWITVYQNKFQDIHPKFLDIHYKIDQPPREQPARQRQKQAVKNILFLIRRQANVSPNQECRPKKCQHQENSECVYLQKLEIQ